MEIYVAEKKFFSSSRAFLSHCFEIGTTGAPLPPIATTALGKPYFLHSPQSPDHSHFNLSHSGSYLAIAFHHSPLGLDIQIPKHPSQVLLQRVCTAREQQWFLQHPQFFHLLWVRKEAYCKYTGEGIGTGRFLKKLEFPLPNPHLSTEILPETQGKQVHFTVYQGQKLPEDYAIAVCSREVSKSKLIFLPESNKQ